MMRIYRLRYYYFINWRMLYKIRNDQVSLSLIKLLN